MSTQNSAQNSITIKRLRNGDSLQLTLESNGIPLYQGVDTSSGSVAPNWGEAANQPVLKPRVRSVQGNTVALSGHQWKHNGVPLLFTGAASGDWRADTTGRFQLNVSGGDDDGSLRIVKNLANAQAVANALLEYSCVATVAGTNYNLSKSADVVKQAVGMTSCYGAVIATPQTIDKNTPEAVLSTTLYVGTTRQTAYLVRWLRDRYDPSGNTTAITGPTPVPQQTLTVDRDMVDGSQLFIAEFFLKADDTTPCATAGVTVFDIADEYKINLHITSAATDVAPGQDVTVKGEVWNTRTNSLAQVSNPRWRMDVMDKDTWTSLKSSAADTITVTTAETDRNNRLNDVEVVAEVEFS